MNTLSKLIVFGLIITSFRFGLAQSGLEIDNAKKAEAVVEGVVQNTLKRGEGVVNGYKTSTWVPVSSTDRQKVEELGASAIVPLSARLSSNVPFIQLIAVQLLGTIGRAQSVIPLQKALDSQRWVVVRMQALTSLTSTPDAMAIPIISGMRKDGIRVCVNE
jgi:hypothetical protein